MTTRYFGDGPDGNDPMRPECTSSKAGSGEIYVCTVMDCPIHGERNRVIAGIDLNTLHSGKLIVDIVDDEPLGEQTAFERDWDELSDRIQTDFGNPIAPEDDKPLQNLADKHGID